MKWNIQMKWVHKIVKKTQNTYTYEFKVQRTDYNVSGYSPLLTTLFLMLLSCFFLWNKDEKIYYLNAALISTFGGLYSIYSIGSIFINHHEEMNAIHKTTIQQLPRTTGLAKKWEEIGLDSKAWQNILPVILALIIKHDMTANTLLEHNKNQAHRKLSWAEGSAIFSSPFGIQLAENKQQLMQSLNQRILCQLHRLISIYLILHEDLDLPKYAQRQLKKLSRLNPKPSSTQQWLHTINTQYQVKINKLIQTFPTDSLLIDYAKSDLKIIEARLCNNHQKIIDNHCNVLQFIKGTAIKLDKEFRQLQAQ